MYSLKLSFESVLIAAPYWAAAADVFRLGSTWFGVACDDGLKILYV